MQTISEKPELFLGHVFKRAGFARALELPSALRDQLKAAEEFSYVLYRPLGMRFLAIIPTRPFEELPFYNDVNRLVFPYSEKIKMQEDRLVLDDKSRAYLFSDSGASSAQVHFVPRDDFWEIHDADRWGKDSYCLKYPKALENLQALAAEISKARRAGSSQTLSSPSGGGVSNAPRQG